MESYEIHTTFQSLEHPYQSISMGLCVIETGKHRIFKTHPALAGEIILLYQIYNFLDRPCTLYRHHAQTFRSERIMETDSQVASALVQIPLQIRKDSDCGNRYPLRAPRETPVSSKDLDGTHHIFIIVQRLSHTHEHGIGKSV